MVTPLALIDSRARLAVIRKKLKSAKAGLLVAESRLGVAQRHLREAPKRLGQALADQAGSQTVAHAAPLEDAKLNWSQAVNDEADAAAAYASARKEVDRLTRFEEAAAKALEKAIAAARSKRK